MASNVNANIVVDIQTAKAQANLRALQAQVAALNKTMSAATMQDMARGADGVIKSTTTQVARLDSALASSSRKVGASFKTMQEIAKRSGAAQQLAIRRAETLNSTYRQIGGSSGGIAAYNKQLATMTTTQQVAAQRQIILNRAIMQGSTAMLNYGKNIQWAGRQMMVGFTVPLTILGGLAAKTFMDMERQIINLERVYGDFNTSEAEAKKMTETIKEQALEFTKWGATVTETIELAASAAATGLTGTELTGNVEQATKLATLGMISQEQALTTMISLNSAFGIQADELERTVDFLNAVENQTVLALSDVTEAIPLVAPVIKGLGGDIEDLAVMLTAMREGGIGANEAANALKTSLARLVTPAKAARDRAEELGINLKAIVEDNEGDLMGMINELARAMQGLGDLQKQQLLSDLFGKRQFARMGALFTNLADEASQAKRVIDLTAESTENLAQLSQKELGALEESTGMQFKAALEDLKVAIAPIGEVFLKAINPVIKGAIKIANFFNDLSDGAKTFITYLAGFAGVLVPIGIMITGIAIQFTSFIVKGIAGFLKLTQTMRGTVSSFEYLTLEQTEAKAAALQLASAEDQVTKTLNAQAQAVARLGQAYVGMNTQRKPSGIPGVQVKMATGGNVPGVGNTDSVPALLTPGEFVVKKSQANKHRGFLNALNSGGVQRYATGGNVGGGILSSAGYGGATAGQLAALDKALSRLTINTENAAQAQRMATVSLEASAKAGASAGVAIENFKKQMEGAASYVGTQRSHVVDEISGSAGISAVQNSGGFAASDAALEDLLMTLQQLGPEALQTSVEFKALGNAVADLPTGMNQGLKGGGSMSAKGAKQLITPSQRQNPGSLFNKTQDQMLRLDMGVETAANAADQMGREFTQLLDAVDDDTIIVESQEMAADMKEAGQKVESINGLMEKAAQNVADDIPEFAQAWETISNDVSSFRVTLKKEIALYERELKRAGISIKNLGAAGGSVITGVTSARGSTTVKNAGTMVGARGSGGLYYGADISRGNQAQITAAAQRDAQAYKAARDAAMAGTDPYLEGRQRNSPHPQAAADGKSDASSYSQARKAGLKTSDPYTQSPMAGSFNAINSQMAAASQRVIASSNVQAASQTRFSTVTNMASVAMNKVVSASKRMSASMMANSGRLSAGMGAATGGLFALSMFGEPDSPIQKLASQVTPVLFGLSALQMALPLLANPIVLVALALAAVGGTLWAANSAWNKTIDELDKYTAALSGSRNDLEELSKIYQTISKTESERLRQIKKRTGSGVSGEQLSEAQQTLQTDFGKELLDSTQNLADSAGNGAAAQALANRLTRAVLDGVISDEQARALAAAVADELDNTNLGIETTLTLNEIIGPDGNKIEGNEIDIYTNLILDPKDLEAQIDQIWEAQSLLSKIGGTIFGGGREEIGTVLIAQDALNAAQLYEEQQANINQKIVDGTLKAEDLNAALVEMEKSRKAATISAQLDAQDLAVNQLPTFFGVIDEELGNLGLEEEVKKQLTEGIKAGTEELDKFSNMSERKYNGAKVGDPAELNAALKKYNEEIAQFEKAANDRGAMESVRKNNQAQADFLKQERKELIETTAAYYDYAEAISRGVVAVDENTDFEKSFAEFRKGLEQGEDAIDRFLKSEFMEGTSIYKKIFGGDNQEAQQMSDEFRDRLVGATAQAIQQGIEMESVYKMVNGSLYETVKTMEDFAYLSSEVFDNLPKEDQKTFIYNMAMDMSGFDEELLAELEALPVKAQKDFILNITTVYDTVGTPPKGMSSEVWNMLSNGEQEAYKLGQALDAAKPAEKSGDKPIDSSGGGGGSKELSWVEEREKAYREANAMYGKILNSQKGLLDKVRNDVKISEDIIELVKNDLEALTELSKMTVEEAQEFNKNFRKTSALTAEADLDTLIAEGQRTANAINNMRGGYSEDIVQFIKSNDKLMTLWLDGGKKGKDDAVEGAKALMQQAEALKSPLKAMSDAAKAANTLVGIGLENTLGIDDEALRRKNQTLQKEISYLQLSQIRPIEKKIDAEQKLIDEIEREVELLERGTEQYEDQIAALDRQVEQMQRADELAMRESEYLDHDLKLMGYMEETINETYETRIESLTKVEEINKRIAEQQKQQLSLADALSSGDVSAAAAAAQAMQQNSMQAAADQFKAQLASSRDSQLASLTGAESGMTREQIEQRQRELEEQSYYTNLKIRDVEDQIYNINLKIAGEQAFIDEKVRSIRVNDEAIRDLEQQILDIEESRIEPIQDQIDANNLALGLYDYELSKLTEVNDTKIANLDEQAKVEAAVAQLGLTELTILENQYQQIGDNTKAMVNFGRAAEAAYNAIQGAGMNFAGGDTERIRKTKIADLQRQLTSELAGVSSLTQASYNLPTSAVGSAAVNGIMGRSSNYMNNNVNVNATGASAEQVAAIVIQKLEVEKLRNIGGQ